MVTTLATAWRGASPSRLRLTRHTSPSTAFTPGLWVRLVPVAQGKPAVPAGTEVGVAAVILAGCGGLLLGYDNGAPLTSSAAPAPAEGASSYIMKLLAHAAKINLPIMQSTFCFLCLANLCKPQVSKPPAEPIGTMQESSEA